MHKEDDVYQQILSMLEELFDINTDQVSLQTSLYQDLDLDSIDAVDLVIELKKITGKKIQPDDFKSVRNIQDLVDAVMKLLNDSK
ncbi:MAG: acyl carrier protein [Gammaproteobacteria bacterium]|nr:MAG: acyl carrier protein [Gammaproteobacteria bacterium]